MSESEKKIIVQKRGTRAIVPAKANRDEEIKRLADLALTLSKRIRQLDTQPIK